MNSQKQKGLFWTIGVPYIVSFLAVYLWMIIAQVVSIGVYMHKHGGTPSQTIPVMQNKWGIQSGINMVMELVLLAVLVFFVRKAYGSFDRNCVGLVGKRICVLLGICLVVLINFAVFAFAIGTGILHGLGFGTTKYSIGTVVLYTVVSCISTMFPGVIEEMFFRGYIQKRMSQSRGPVFAIIVTSLLFALMHIALYPTILGLLTVFVLGLILGTLYYKTQSLYLPIGFHFAWDFLNSVIGDGKQPSVFSIQDLTTSKTTDSLLLVQLVVLVCVLLFTLLKRKRGVDVSASV